MTTLLTLLAWLILLIVCWPLALLALVLWPVVWLLSLPCLSSIVDMSDFSRFADGVFERFSNRPQSDFGVALRLP